MKCSHRFVSYDITNLGVCDDNPIRKVQTDRAIDDADSALLFIPKNLGAVKGVLDALRGNESFLTRVCKKEASIVCMHSNEVGMLH